MKFVVVVLCVTLGFAQGKVLPDYLSQLVCLKNDPNYEKCVYENYLKASPYLMKGIPELALPPFDPFELPLMTVNRTLNELISIKGVLKNIKVSGAKEMVIEGLKANPNAMSGDIRVTLPVTTLEMDYDVTGQLLVVPLRSKGHFIGNFSDTQIYAKGNLKTIDKDGVKYFRVDKFFTKIRVGDGHVSLKADNKNLQFGADLIANFYNGNPRRVMDAVNPIFVESATELFIAIANQILAGAPAKEWLPE